MTATNQCIVYDVVVDGKIARLLADGVAMVGDSPDSLLSFPILTETRTGKPWLPSSEEQFVEIVRHGLANGDFSPDRSGQICLKEFVDRLRSRPQPGT